MRPRQVLFSASNLTDWNLKFLSSNVVTPLVIYMGTQLHPLVAPQVLHFMQVPLRTSV